MIPEGPSTRIQGVNQDHDYDSYIEPLHSPYLDKYFAETFPKGPSANVMRILEL